MIGVSLLIRIDDKYIETLPTFVQKLVITDNTRLLSGLCLAKISYRNVQSKEKTRVRSQFTLIFSTVNIGT